MDSNGSRDERRRQTFPDRDTTGRAKAVKPPGFSQRVEPSPALEKEVSKATGDAGVWERVFQRDNLLRALVRVERNGGSPGIDGMTVAELRPYLKRHWPEIRAALDAETYQPKPVLRREIPKSGGGVRLLGIPTVIDRLIQQALAQVLTPLFEPVFSDSSYGFRPGRKAHDAVRCARAYINEGYGWVVDIDLEKFFDRVNHDKLMARVARVVKDRRVLKLIRKYLESGVMVNGVVVEMREGDAAGRAAFATLGQHHVGRPGQRTGEARASVCALCGRLQHLRQKSAGRRATACRHRAVSGAEARASGQREEERCRPAAEAEVLELQLLLAAGSSADSRGRRGERPLLGATAATDQTYPVVRAGGSHPGHQRVYEGLD